jgi:hypothetical protein
MLKMFSPLKVILPFFNGIRSRIHFAIVDFPDPDSPTIPKTSPLNNSKEILFKTVVFPKETEMFFISSIGL